jgi:hypothetical protein
MGGMELHRDLGALLGVELVGVEELAWRLVEVVVCKLVVVGVEFVGYVGVESGVGQVCKLVVVVVDGFVVGVGDGFVVELVDVVVGVVDGTLVVVVDEPGVGVVDVVVVGVVEVDGSVVE